METKLCYALVKEVIKSGIHQFDVCKMFIDLDTAKAYLNKYAEVCIRGYKTVVVSHDSNRKLEYFDNSSIIKYEIQTVNMDDSRSA